MREKTDARSSQGKDVRDRLSRSTLEAVKRRDSGALGELFDAYFERLFSFACRLLGDRSVAQDVTQDLFFKVYKAAHQIDPERDPGPWLLTIAHNTCREYWRKRGRKVEGHSQSLDADPVLTQTMANGSPDPERAALSSQRESLIQDALMELSQPLRTVVVLYDIEGMTHKEIAGLLSTTPTAVRKRYSRALSRLREHLQDALE
jgi:RNA polymerase sigma-70 factor (ECF subfamily)